MVMLATFSQKYCVACKKSTLKVLIYLGFVTSFENSHYISLFRYIYGAQLIQWCFAVLVWRCFAIQNTFMSTVVLINEVSEVLQRHKLLSAILLTSSRFLQNCRFWYHIFFNEDTAGVLGNRYITDFLSFAAKLAISTQKLMLRWDSPFKGRLPPV